MVHEYAFITGFHTFCNFYSDYNYDKASNGVWNCESLLDVNGDSSYAIFLSNFLLGIEVLLFICFIDVTIPLE